MIQMWISTIFLDVTSKLRWCLIPLKRAFPRRTSNKEKQFSKVFAIFLFSSNGNVEFYVIEFSFLHAVKFNYNDIASDEWAVWMSEINGMAGLI